MAIRGALIVLGMLVLVTQPDLGGQKSLFKKIEVSDQKKAERFTRLPIKKGG